MDHLFIHLYLDEDVDVLVAQLLRARGFDAVTTLDAGRLGSTDADQLAYAARDQRALVTHNRADSEALANSYYQSGQTHAGIIIVVRRPAPEIVRRLLLILDQVAADDMANQVRYI